MDNFNKIEDTLFVPMLGRIYATEKFPNILEDKKALELKEKLPKEIKGKDTQTQYTLLAGAVRSTNMDRYIKEFLKENPDGIIVELGCGLETTFFRVDNGKAIWYEIDLPEVIEYREKLIGKSERDIILPEDAFSEEWIKVIRREYPDKKILVTASGFFYYFEEKAIIELMKTLKKYGEIEVVFDIVNKLGMSQISRYMKQVGHEDATMYFYVDNVEELSKKIDAKKALEEKYYKYTQKKKLKLMTSISMRVADKFNMVKMVYLKLN